MKTSNLVIWLSALIVVLALVAASIGLFWQAGGSSFTFTTLRGDTVSIAGQGLYRYDTTLVAMVFQAGDAVTLVLGIPALIFSLLRYRRGSTHFSSRLPRREIGIYSIVAGVILLSIWPGLSIIPALVEGKAPLEVWSYTTVVTYAIDLGIIAPALIVAGVLLLRTNPIGLAYLLSSTLLIFTVILGVNLLTAGTIQMLAGLINIGQFIGFVASFAILTLYACWFTLALFRNVSERISSQDPHLLDLV
jgi:hypothetical protein